jgi:broad specificity phosphatase PhoE
MHCSSQLSIVLAGESINDRDSVRGGDTALSPDGVEYAAAAAALVAERASADRPPPLGLAGTLCRYSQMGAMLDDLCECVLPMRALNELCFGSFEGLKAGTMAELFPEECRAAAAPTSHPEQPQHADQETAAHSRGSVRTVTRLASAGSHSHEDLSCWRTPKSMSLVPRRADRFSARTADKLNYRYPGVGGQSYFDLVTQMREVLLLIESTRRDTVVVCDVAVARVLMGYFEAVDIGKIPDLPISHGIIELTRTHSGFVRTDVPVHVGKISMIGNINAARFVKKVKNRSSVHVPP